MRCNECGLVNYFLRNIPRNLKGFHQNPISYPDRHPNTATALAAFYFSANLSLEEKDPYLPRSCAFARRGGYYTILQLALDHGFPHIAVELLAAGAIYNPTTDTDYKQAITSSIVWHVSSPAHVPGPITECYRAILLLINGHSLQTANKIVEGEPSAVVAALLTALRLVHRAPSANPFTCLP